MLMKGIRELAIMVAEEVRFRFYFEGCIYRWLEDFHELSPSFAKVGGSYCPQPNITNPPPTLAKFGLSSSRSSRHLHLSK